MVLPELAVLRFGVYDENDKLLGQRILPFNDLQMGYRHVALKTEANFPMALSMLFVQIDVKIYVPDGFGDFMDALSDPRAFASAQEKRAEQLKSLGIEESEIGTNVIESKKKSGAAGAKKEDDKPKKEEIKFDPITPEGLMMEKAFNKAAKKYIKEVANLKKKQTKEVAAVVKSQCTSFEKASKGKKYKTPEEVEKDEKLMKMVREQTKEWTELMQRQRKVTWEMGRTHYKAYEEILKPILETAQTSQVKELEVRCAADIKEMQAEQVKASVETSKEVQNDPKLKTKAEKDRRLKEKQAANTKRFMDERKNIGIQHNKAKNKLKNAHTKQLEDLGKWIKTKIQIINEEEGEYKLANKREAFV